MKYVGIFIISVWLISMSLAVRSDIRVTDFSGQEVILKQPAQRIIALAPHIVENVFSAGAGDLIVGTVSYADFPEAATAIPRVGNIQGFSMEAIIALKPDLVISWASGHSQDISQQLKKMHIPVYVSEPRKLEDIATSILDIGVMTNKRKESEIAANQFLMALNQLRTRYADTTPVTVLYQVWNQPLQTLNDEHIISDVIRLCGGRNRFGDAVVIAPKISVESVLERNPEVIVASGMGEERPQWLDMWKQWPSLTAVKRQQLFFIPPDIIQRHTARILLGARQLCQQLQSVRLNHR